MPKIIAPKRTSKNVSAEEYWSIRQKFTKEKDATGHSYKQKQVQKRHRFLKLRDQINSFNPLQYFLSKDQILADDKQIHTHAYLQTIHFHLPQEIMHVKKLMFGLPLILQNIEVINCILFDHLNSDDAWKLLQCLLRDTRQQSYQSWLNFGLQKTVQNLGTEFKQSRFKQIFTTLCTFMDLCYGKICQDEHSLMQFSQKFCQFYMTNQNKYIRKFSIKCISYLFSNIRQETYFKFIENLINNSENHGLLYSNIGHLLSQRLKYSDGALTPNSLQQLINISNWLNIVKAPTNVMTAFIFRVLGNLQQKKAHEENETLFDFGYVVKAFIELSRQNRIQAQCFVEGLTMYLQETINQKHARPRHINEELMPAVGEYLWQHLPSLSHKQHVYHILALSFTLPLTNMGNIMEYLSKTTNEQLALDFLQSIGDDLNKETAMLLIASFKQQIQSFLINPIHKGTQAKVLIIYKLLLLSKKHDILFNLQKMFGDKISLTNSIDQLAIEHKKQVDDQTQLYYCTLTFLRLLTIIELPNNIAPSLIALLDQSLKGYYEVLRSYFDSEDKFNTHIFSCNKYVEQIFLYSHSSIPFVWRGFNILESFIEIQKKIKTNIIDRKSQNYSLWHKIVVNRVSICNEVKNVLAKSMQNYTFTLRSRHRIVRHLTIEHLIESNLFEGHQRLIEMIRHIDSDDVDLQTQRDVKRMLLDMLRYIQQNQLSIQINNAAVCWCLGFAFTGFKLIEQSFANFLSGLIETQQKINLDFVMSFVEYYTFRNSRIYDQQISTFFNSSKQKMGKIQLSSSFIDLANKDFENFQMETIEFIGVDRVALAISKSEKVKKKFGNRLQNLLNQYFSEQFVRHKNELILSQGYYMSQSGEANKLLLPPKTTFLKQILKMVPRDYLPPLQCLHFTQQYLKLESVLKIKTQQWQLLWHKSTKMDHTQIQFGSLSEPQKQLYIHFLWGQMLKSDANRLRIIIEHIRDNMNSKVQFLMSIYLNQLALGVEDEERLKQIFAAMDSRKLLTFIYILKAIAKTLRNYLTDNFDKVFNIIINMVQILEPNIQETQMEAEQQNEQQNEEENQNEEEQEDESEEKETQQTSINKFKKYKNHRKEIFKILNSLVALLYDEIAVSQIDRIMGVFRKQKKISNLWNVSLHSTPGLLLFMNELSKHSKFHQLLVQYQVIGQIEQIFRHGFSMQTNSSLAVCIQIVKNLLHIRDQDDIVSQDEQNMETVIDSKIASGLLSSMFVFVTQVGKISVNLQQQVLKILLQLFKLSETAEVEWQKYLLMQMTKIVSMKSMSFINKTKLSLLLQISMQYANKAMSSEFLTSMLVLIPQLKDIEHRKIIVTSIAKDIESGKKSAIGPIAAQIVYKLNCTIDGGLVQQMDYSSFFEGISKYKQKLSTFSLQQHEFIIYNVLAYLTSQQLSARKAVCSSLQIFLSLMNSDNRQLVSKLFRIVSEQLKKPYNAQDHIFWSIFSSIGLFTRWVISNDLAAAPHYSIFTNFVNVHEKADNDMFQLLCAIAQNKKLEGLKAIKSILKNDEINFENKIGDKYPNILTGIFLPILEHFILPPIPTASNRFDMATNLASSLAHVGLEVYELVMKRGGESLQKKQLKRIISKIKFQDSHMKRNIIIIKIIGQIVQSIQLPKVTEFINKTIKQQGFDDFHKKFVQKQSKTSKIRENRDEDSDEEEEIKKKLAFNGFNNDIDDEELINMGYLTLDKKFMRADQLDQKIEEPSVVRFLKMHVLTPLKTMLMFQNRSQKNSKEESDKSRMFLSIVVTKIIMKFPSDVFLNELQKILSKLGRLLKKRQIQIRQNARKCLAEIAKLVGPDMFYIIFRQLKFHLRDNFQSHVLNYSIYYILQKYGSLQNGSIDHCLPIILPSIIDELFGKSAAEKQLVDENLIPVINMQSRKKKGNDLLTIICRQISILKIDYLVKYFQKFLLQYMNTEANVSKYEQMLTNMIGGLNKNEVVMSTQNSKQFIQILHESIQKLKGQIKLYKFDDAGLKHESTIRQQQGLIKKTGKEVLQIQEEAGKNASIFKKQAKQIQERRNHQILISCFMQFYLALLALLIKKKIIDSEIHNQKFESIITFIVECIEHRDNRIVHKCLKVIHNVINWKKLQNIAQIRKKASRKIFVLIQKLTGADEDLLRECFTLLNDLFEEVNITAQVLNVLVTIIRLHITTVQRTMVEQPYKLLKTVMIKISNDHTLMQDQSIYELYEYVRNTMISTTSDHIRSVCKDICCIYIKQQNTNQVAIGKKKHHKQQSGIDFGKQMSFYLNNLDCKYSETQSAILDVIRTYVMSHSKEELEETGQIIIMALGTAYSNDQDNQTKISDLIKFVCQKIDNSKVLSLVDKSLVWAANDSNQLIAACGFFILKCILQAKSGLLNANRMQTTVDRCSSILSKQYDNYLIYQADLKEKANQAQTLKDNPQWENIIQSEDVYLKIQKNFKSAITTLDTILDQYKSIEKQQILLLWRLAQAPSEIIHNKVAAILLKVKSIVQAIGEKIVSTDKEEEDSFKNKITSIVRKSNEFQNLQYIPAIFSKVFNQIKDDENIILISESLVFSLLNRISKSILNLKKNQKSMSLSFSLLQILFLTDKQICQKLLKNEKLLGQIFWNVAKVNRNQLIETSIKEKNEQFSQILKSNIQEAEFYRKLASVEADRKQKKANEKAELMKLAITDQEAFGQAKARKKHKKG